MNTFVFEVPRIKEESVDIFLYMLDCNILPVKRFHAEKWRFNNQTTIYTIYYELIEEEEDE